MKKRFFVALVSILVCIQSCVIAYQSIFYLNNEEVIKINTGGSGEYSMQLDLHDDFVQLKKTLDSVPEMKDFLSRINMMKMDTAIFFNKEISQSTDLSEQEKSMFNNGSLTISVNPMTEKGLITIQFFFNDFDQLNFERAHVWNFIKNNFEFGSNLPFISKGFNLSDKNSLNYKVIEGPYKINPNSLISNPIGSFSTMKVSNKKIENVFNSLFWERNPDVEKIISDLKVDSLYTDQVFYKTTIILPTEVKKYAGNGNLTTDKKAITYKNTLKDILYNPRQLEFSLEYQ